MTLRSFHMKITLVFSQSDARITNFIVFVIKLFWHKYYLLQNIKSSKKLTVSYRKMGKQWWTFGNNVPNSFPNTKRRTVRNVTTGKSTRAKAKSIISKLSSWFLSLFLNDRLPFFQQNSHIMPIIQFINRQKHEFRGLELFFSFVFKAKGDSSKQQLTS